MRTSLLDPMGIESPGRCDWSRGDLTERLSVQMLKPLSAEDDQTVLQWTFLAGRYGFTVSLDETATTVTITAEKRRGK